MDTTEDDAFRLAGGGAAGEFQGIAGDIRVAEHGGTLIMVSQDQQPGAKITADGFDGIGDVDHAYSPRE